jgi:exopolysaccharide production protein ExoQ
MLGALFSALAFVAALGLLVGQNEVWGGEVTLVGLFGSKNYFGYSVGLLLLTATIVAFDRSRPGIVRLIAFAAAAVSPVLLVLSRSTGALVFSMAAIAVTCPLAFVARFVPAFRFAALLLMAFLVVLFLIVWLYVGDFTTLLNSLGKDVTLTGRTWMWKWADMAIEQHSMLGVGYQAYWQPGNWGAEEIWSHDLKVDKTGYHFHNTFLQVTVDLGYVGLLVLLATLATISARIGSCLLFSRPDAEQIFAIAMFLFHLFRLPLEVDLFWQFQIPTVLLSMIWVYLGLPGRRRSGEPRASVYLRRSPLRLRRTHP